MRGGAVGRPSRTASLVRPPCVFTALRREIQGPGPNRGARRRVHEKPFQGIAWDQLSACEQLPGVREADGDPANPPSARAHLGAAVDDPAAVEARRPDGHGSFVEVCLLYQHYGASPGRLLYDLGFAAAAGVREFSEPPAVPANDPEIGAGAAVGCALYQ